MKKIFFFSTAIAIVLWLFLSDGDPVDSSSNEVALPAQANIINGNTANQTSILQANQSVKIIEKIEQSGQINGISQQQREQVLNKFSKANEYVINRQWQEAESIYIDLIKEQPLVIGPYINLAAVYAGMNRTDDARKVLLQGLKANQNYAVLFDNLQSIHGALAAEAYRAALVTDSTSSRGQETLSQLNLPIIDSIDMNLIDSSQVMELGKQLTALQNDQKKQLDWQSRIADLENELAIKNRNVIEGDDESSTRIATLEAQLKDLEAELSLRTQALALTEKELTDLKSSSSQIASEQQRPIGTATQVPTEITAVTDVPSVTSTAVETQTSSELSDSQSTDSFPADKEAMDVAFSLVKKWADSWSQQDVNRYIEHYADDYSPPRAQMTHLEWMDQRKVRLTNKKFIKVDVSDFEFQEQETSQFSVTFTQRYRSNTIDDTIRKQLVFAKNEDSFLDAKIVDEVIVPN